MRFITNKLGVVIVLIALVASLFVGVITNTTSETKTVTDYSYVADMSQTFTYDDLPDYTQYNPTKNYSGYVMSDGSGAGIKYSQSSGASNYRVMDTFVTTSRTNTTADILTNNTSIVPPKRVNDTSPTGTWEYAVIIEKILRRSYSGDNYQYFALRDGSKMGVAYLSDALSSIVTSVPTSATTITIDFASHTNVRFYDYSGYEYIDSNLVYYAPYQWNPSGQVGYWPTYMTPQIMPDYTPGSTANVQYPIKYDLAKRTYYQVTGAGDVAFDPTGYVLYWSLIDGGTGKPYAPYNIALFNGSSTELAPPVSFEGEWTSNVYISYDTITYKSMKINDGVRISNTDTSVTTNWSNDVDNGIVDILFGTNNTTLMENSFTLNYKDGTTQTVAVSRADNGPVVLTVGTNDYTVGTWDNFLLRLDAIGGGISVYPVTSFTNYTTFTASSTPLQLGSSATVSIPTGIITSISYDAVTQDPAIITQNTDGLTSFTFSVTDTTIYLSNKFLMVDPSIDINKYFTNADMEGWRLNFYSFATQGTSMTVNGVTYPVADGRITINDRSYKLNNVYVSYDKLTDHVYFTFANDRITLDLGEWTTSVVSFGGAWFFNTGYYEADITTFTETNIQWTRLPPMGTVALIFIALTIILSVIAIKKIGFEAPDYIVTIVSLAVALCLLEVFI